jgi:hypothetical protein
MASFLDPGGTTPLAAERLIPPAVPRIRRRLYWQAAFAVVRSVFGLLFIVSMLVGIPSRGGLVGAADFPIGAALAVASIRLGRQVRSRRRGTRTAIIAVAAVAAAFYGLLGVRGVVEFVTSVGAVGEIPYNAIGLAIALEVLRVALSADLRNWYDQP